MSATSIEFGGHALHLHSSGALYWPAHDLLVISDLHIEKGSSFYQRRMFLPPYDTAETLARLAQAIDAFGAGNILLLGDVFHDKDAGTRMKAADRMTFDALLGHERVIWIAGNHDEGVRDARFIPSYAHDNLHFRHIASEAPEAFEISGHYHPAARIRHKGQKVRAACFLVTGRRMIMPSFGAYTGGLDISDEAMRPYVNEESRVYMLGKEKVYAAPLEKIAF